MLLMISILNSSDISLMCEVIYFKIRSTFASELILRSVEIASVAIHRFGSFIRASKSAKLASRNLLWTFAILFNVLSAANLTLLRELDKKRWRMVRALVSSWVVAFSRSQRALAAS